MFKYNLTSCISMNKQDKNVALFLVLALAIVLVYSFGGITQQTAIASSSGSASAGYQIPSINGIVQQASIASCPSAYPVSCGNNWCGNSQAYCDNYNNYKQISCTSDNFCCNDVGWYMDFTAKKCCATTWPFLKASENSCYTYAQIGSNNYLTNQGQDCIASMPSRCEGDYQVTCQSNKIQRNQVNGQCGYINIPTPPTPPTPTSCTYTYSDWSICSSANNQIRTVISSTPSGCTGTPVTSQLCTVTPSTTPWTLIILGIAAVGAVGFALWRYSGNKRRRK